MFRASVNECRPSSHTTQTVHLCLRLKTCPFCVRVPSARITLVNDTCERHLRKPLNSHVAWQVPVGTDLDGSNPEHLTRMTRASPEDSIPFSVPETFYDRASSQLYSQ